MRGKSDRKKEYNVLEFRFHLRDIVDSKFNHLFWFRRFTRAYFSFQKWVKDCGRCFRFCIRKPRNEIQKLWNLNESLNILEQWKCSAFLQNCSMLLWTLFHHRPTNESFKCEIHSNMTHKTSPKSVFKGVRKGKSGWKAFSRSIWISMPFSFIENAAYKKEWKWF